MGIKVADRQAILAAWLDNQFDSDLKCAQMINDFDKLQ